VAREAPDLAILNESAAALNDEMEDVLGYQADSGAHACSGSGTSSGPGLKRRLMTQPGGHVNGIHEVTGSIPVSSTNSENNLPR
jgi:hypothetical protein